ncbi:unnamed protein product, partial [marine sediment metagenome]
MESLPEVYQQIVDYLPKIGKSVAILIAGLIFAMVIRLVISRGLAAIRFDKLSDRLGIAEFLKKGHVEYTFSRLIATVIYWFVIVFALFAAADALGIPVLASFVEKVAAYAPNLVVGMLI